MPATIEQNQWHVVEEGENVFLIAKQAGFRNWQTIYNDERNGAFRKKNPNPDSIHIGDRIWVPQKNAGSGVVCATNKEHQFVAMQLKTKLNFVLQDPEGRRYPNKRYEIWIDGQRYGNAEQRTTSNGLLKTDIPVVQELELKVWMDGDSENPSTYLIRPSDLDPIDTIRGVQDRLNNLGFNCGAEQGEIGPLTTAALMAFQNDQGLTATGEIDEGTRSKLKSLHDFQ